MFGQLVLSCIPITSTNSSAIAGGTPHNGAAARRAYEPLSRQRLPGAGDYEDWNDTNDDYGSVGGGRNPAMFAPSRQPTEQEIEAVTVSVTQWNCFSSEFFWK